MSDGFDREGSKKVDSKQTSDVGSGARSLSNWQKLAAARDGEGDARAMLGDYGIDAAALGNTKVASLEKRLAFAGEVERDTLGVHRAVALVVGPVALAVAGAAVLAGAVVGNVTTAVNAIDVANVVYQTNWVSADGGNAY
jgi:hypothetical protein